MNRTVKKIWDGITTILVALVVVLAVLLVGVRVVGMQVFTVLSGSMEPTYHAGSLIYVKEVDPFRLEANDVITFMLDENTVATHRIVEVVPDEEDPTVVRFRTKGDANDAVDGGLVHYKNVIGSPVFTIPKLGYVANYIQNPPGTYIAIAGGAFLLMLVFSAVNFVIGLLPDILDMFYSFLQIFKVYVHLNVIDSIANFLYSAVSLLREIVLIGLAALALMKKPVNIPFINKLFD
jgi:signal peptidase